MTKDLGMETQPREGVVKEKKFPHSMKPSHRLVYGEFWSLRGQHNQERKKENPQNTHLTSNTSREGEVAQMLTSNISELGVGRQARAALLVLRVRLRPDCPEDNLRELM